MEEDISNKTIVVLVVLTVIISVLSTLVVLNEVANIDARTYSKASKTSDATSGKLSFEIKGQPQQDQSTGRVALEITPRE